MLRKLHAYPALIAALLVSFMAITGAVLSLQPAVEQLQTASSAGAQSDVAALLGEISISHAQPQRLVRMASGSLILYYRGQNGPGADTIDPKTGKSIAPYAPSAFFTFFIELHRSLFARDNGRIVTGVAAGAMVILSITGFLMLVRRLGGWRQVFGPARGTQRQRRHVTLGRAGVAVMLLTAMTGVWMTLYTFGLTPGSEMGFMLTPMGTGGHPAAISSLAGLQDIAVNNLRELIYPASGNLQDVFTVTTNAGVSYVDQATGNVLSYVPNSLWQNIYQAVYTLHTGQGAWWYALILGAAALCIPVLAYTGILLWWRRLSETPKIRHNVRPNAAEVVILVGSEGNSTWGFAATLHATLTQNGHAVHAGRMNALPRAYRSARHVFVLTATYGDGEAPASANRFLARLEKFTGKPDMTFAVLGFGDRSFPQFCKFAEGVDSAMTARGLKPLRDFFAIDRQSVQSFAQWGEEIGARLGEKLALHYVPSTPKTATLLLEKRLDFGDELQSPKSILRFVASNGHAIQRRRFAGSAAKGLASFEVGDLVGIVPPGSLIPRYYSLASDMRDGFLEVCVSKQPGGVCSGFLHQLRPGEAIEAFVRPNPDFRPHAGRKPLVLIGAGTGIAPFAGFVRRNFHKRPIYLYWGGRDATSDFLYRDDLLAWRADGRLTGAKLAFSRTSRREYVQDKLREDTDFIREMLADKAQFMVCGGTAMAEGVRDVIDEILAPLHVTAHDLKRDGRYLEDVY